MKFPALNCLTRFVRLWPRHEDKEKQRTEGLAIARSLLDTAWRIV